MSFEPADLAAFLASEAEAAEIVVFAPSGARLHAYALDRLAEALARFPDAALAYSDIVVTDGQDREWPLAFPAFDYERLLEQGYAALFFAARVAHVHAALARGAADLYRLFNSAFDAAGPAGVGACRPCAGLPGAAAGRRPHPRRPDAGARHPRASGGARTQFRRRAARQRPVAGRLGAAHSAEPGWFRS